MGHSPNPARSNVLSHMLYARYKKRTDDSTTFVRRRWNPMTAFLSATVNIKRVDVRVNQTKLVRMLPRRLEMNGETAAAG
jgi:hypothetical protein